MYRPTNEEVQTIEANDQCRLASADCADRYLAGIDNAMNARADEKKKKSRS